MSTKLKLILAKKIFPKVKRDAFQSCLNAMQIYSKNGENSYFIDFDLEKSKVVDKPNNTDSSPNNTNINLINCEQNILRFGISKDFFIKNVVEGIVKKVHVESKPKKIVIDYSSPNIAKPFHVGHLRSTIIGNFIANINKYFNNHVTSLNYLGDWGTQFGLLQYGLKARKLDVNQLQDNPMKTLYDAYVYANKMATEDKNVNDVAKKYFSDIESGKENLANWAKIRDITVAELQKVYERLGIQFDEYHWESDYNGNAIQNVMNNLEDLNILRTHKSGKKVATVNNRDITVLKSDNSTLYISRDIAYLLDKYNKYNFDEMIYVVDNAQTDHFAALFNIVGQVNANCAKCCEHVKFGRIKGMSTRSGNVVFLNDILDEAKEKMHEKQKQSKNTRTTAMDDTTCNILGTTAVIINDLKQRRTRDYDFDWDKALQSDGDSGIKLQYLHCRLWSLEQNAGVKLPEEFDPKYVPETIVADVIGQLAKFDDILYKASIEKEACIIVNYLFRLSKNVNRMFSELNVKNVSHDLASQRLLVYHCARLVLKDCLEILGVRPLYEM